MNEKPVHLCQAIKDNGRPCHRIDTNRVRVFLDRSTIPDKHTDWIRVWLCRVHRAEVKK